MKVTFLEAANKLPFAKHYTDTKTFKPYPHIKLVNSFETSVDSIDALHELICAHSEQGHWLLKGNLNSNLVNESRQGKTDRNALSQLLVLDFDGVELKNTKKIRLWDMNQDTLVKLSEQIIKLMPTEMHEVSYISQASASLGLKGNLVSLHIFMLLDVPLPPKTIKLWLQNANHITQEFSEQMELSVNGQSLKYPLDVSIADNSKGVFIAPPTFDTETDNPFKDNSDRIVLVKKKLQKFDMAMQMQELSPQIVYEQSKKIKIKKREAMGLNKTQEKIKVMQIANMSEEVLLNPDRMSIQVSDASNAPYIRCNINNGDSNAYWFNLKDPIYMHNFKGEPIFEIEKADIDFFTSIPELFNKEMNDEDKPELPVAFRDFNSNTYYNGIYNPNDSKFTHLAETSSSAIEGFMRSYGRPMPDFVPEAFVFFDPTTDDPVIDLKSIPYKINTFVRTSYMDDAIVPDEPLKMGYGFHIKGKCPVIYAILRHMLGNGDQEVERFINWLAHIYQTRTKAKTAWVISGVQGTGKGVFANQVLRPLFAREQTTVKTLENLVEQFNKHMANAVICVIEEFRMDGSTAMTRLGNKMKFQITEPSITIRGMRENQVEMPNYTSFIFNTNHVDAVRIEPSDRRYNISPRQEVPLFDAYPQFKDGKAFDSIKDELVHFAGALQTYEVDRLLVQTPIDNNAKDLMRTASLSVFEEFCMAIKEGDIKYFTEILDIKITNVMGSGEIDNAQRYVKSWIANAQAKEYSVIPQEHFRTIYNVYTQANISSRDFSKRLQRNNIEAIRKRPVGASRDENAIRGVVVDWKIDPALIENIISQYFNDKDQKLLHAC